MSIDDLLSTSRDNYVIFLPNGCLLTINRKVIRDSTRLVDLKETVFERAASLPLFGTLKQERNCYVFAYVDKMTGQVEQATDESKLVKSIDIFSLTLKLCERTGNEVDRQLSAQIGKIIGKGLHEFDALKDPQVNNARWRLANLTRSFTGPASLDDHLLSYCYPEILLPQQLNIQFIRHLFPDETFDIDVYSSCLEDHASLRVSFTYTIHELISEIVNLPTFKYNLTHEHYVLRVAGSQEYFYSNNFLIDYETIQHTLLNCSSPQLILEEKNKIACPLALMERTQKERSFAADGNKSRFFDCDENNLSENVSDKFTCTVSEVNNLDLSSENSKIIIRGAVFHGHQQLTEACSSLPVKITDCQKCSVDSQFNFDISIANLTQVSKLCISVVEVRSKCLIGWVNVTLFDYRNQLRQGPLILPLWSVTNRPVDATNDDFYSEGSSATLSSIRDDSLTVKIIFTRSSSVRFSRDPFIVPDEIDFCEKSNDTEANQVDNHMVHLTSICNSMLSSFNLSANEKKLFQTHRHECAKYLPDSLPLVLLSVQWNDRRDAAQMLRLLADWPKIKSSTCLALLTSHFPSVQVKIFALQTLYQLPQFELELLLLPIVQSTRNECFIFSATLQFLLKVALKNRYLGYKIFHLLKCEMEDETVCIPFGLLLETYLRLDRKFISSHIKCNEFICKLTNLSHSINVECETGNESKDDSKKKKVKILSETLQLIHWRSLVDGLICWFDPRTTFSEIDTSKCKVMHSKMKPLSLTFTRQFDSSILHNDRVVVIFKKGDDLRQDKLVLSLIRLLDYIWKESGYNFHLKSYSCIPFTRKLGVIEVVQDAITIANIQKDKRSKATSAFRKDCLHQWLISQNTSEQNLNDAISRFTLSCAGYCVISFILGIADRHSDNIMISKNGQLFHIDFGHILGKFKAKFGIKRERVPFVLTQEFVHVITNGDTDHSALVNFQNDCEEAFILARKHSVLIFNIFNLMLDSGLQEISLPSDLEYLRTTLVTELTEQEARKFFRRKFDEALKNGWKTNLNWFAHNLAKDNV